MAQVLAACEFDMKQLLEEQTVFLPPDWRVSEVPFGDARLDFGAQGRIALKMTSCVRSSLSGPCGTTS